MTIILRAQIEEAQRHTKSNKAAARYLQVDYRRYKQYAELYGLFESHKNLEGIGIDKGFAKRPTSIPLREILAGNHPTYSRRKLKNRLIARKMIPNECHLCGFKEPRLTDGQIPLMLTFKDNNPQHMALENLELLCYNCMFLTQGSPSTVFRKSGIVPQDLPITTADYHDPEDVQLHTYTLTDAEKTLLMTDDDT